MNDIIGRTLGSYQILEQIGRGGMAVVYKGYQPSLDRYVAVKMLPAHLTHEPDFPTRFKREARAVAKLEHPNILAVYDYGHQDDLSYIVMRYVEGGTLSDSMGMPLEMERIVKLIGQIADALDYAHENGVIHRDVKPSNVLLDRGDWPLLTDFGVARMLGATQQLTATGVGMGTPAYMSPEQGLGERVERQSDVYSLGVVLFEMLTGNLPYEAETPLAIVLKHIHDPLPLPSHINPSIPEAVEKVVLKAMAKTAEDRFQTAGELAEGLRRAVQEAEVTRTLDQYPGVASAAVAAAERSTVAPPMERLRRFWWLAPAVAVLALAGVLLGQGVLGIPEASEEATPEAIETSILQTAPAEAEHEAPPEESPEPAIPSDGESASFYDDFGDPAFESSLNSGNWVDQSDPTCSVRQQDGELTFTNEVSATDAECRLYPVLKELPVVPQIHRLESRIWISSDESEELSEHQWYLEAELPQGQWVTICGVYVKNKNAGANMVVRGGGSDEFFKNMMISHDAWHTLRLEVDSESLEISCYVDGLLIGSTIPDTASELSESETRVWMSALRRPGALAITHVDDVHIEISPIGTESAVLYDDFDDPSFEGTLDPARWVNQSDPACSARQELGKLLISNEHSQDRSECRLHIPFKELPVLSEISLLEYGLWLSSDHSDLASEHHWNISADALSQGSWYALCGIAATGEGANAFIEVKNLQSDPYRRNIRVSFDAWHTLSFEVDPESLEISCYADGLLIGSVIPDAASELTEAPIRIQLLATRWPGARATAHVDDVRVDIQGSD